MEQMSKHGLNLDLPVISISTNEAIAICEERKQLQQEYDKLKQDHSDLNEDYQGLMKQRDNLEETYQVALKTINNLSCKLDNYDKLKKDNRHLKKQVSELNNKLFWERRKNEKIHYKTKDGE